MTDRKQIYVTAVLTGLLGGCGALDPAVADGVNTNDTQTIRMATRAQQPSATAGKLASLSPAGLPLAQVASEGSEAQLPTEPDRAGLLSCLSSYSPRITAARNWIASHCGPISACGSLDTSMHSDLKLLSGDYCGCYAQLWNVKDSDPFNGLQVIYHEPAACAWNHIHLKEESRCGMLHFDVDEGTDGDCYDNEPNSKIDAFLCSGGRRASSCR